MVFSFPAFFISEVYFFQILKFLPISTYTLYIVLARVHKISIFQSYLLIVFQNLFNYHSYWWHLCVCSFAQPCLTLCDPMDCSPLGSSVRGILQGIILEWVAIFSSRGSNRPRDRTRLVSPTLRVGSLPPPPGQESYYIHKIHGISFIIFVYFQSNILSIFYLRLWIY